MSDYIWRCQYCKDRLKAKSAGNAKNIQRTHVLNKCKNVSPADKQLWKDTPT